MRKLILWMIMVLILAFLGILLFNTSRSKPWPLNEGIRTGYKISDSAILHLSKAIQFPTISFSDTIPPDSTVFHSFQSFLDLSYPLIRQHLTRTVISDYSLVYEWKGTDPSLKPIILMGHYDVVPVEKAVLNNWTVSPFSGTITDSCVWGRGAVDDKGAVISILEAVESKLGENFNPRRTIFLCFGHDEEIGGKGARAIVDFLEQKKVRAEMVLDEGGQISEKKIKDVKRPIAVIGVAEKGYASFELSVEKEGGHSMMPSKETAIDILSAGLYRLRKDIPEARLIPTVKEFLRRIGPSSDKYLNRLAVSNMWLFEGLLAQKLSAFPEGYAMTHTTIVPTILESGMKENVIPGLARAIINSRILPGETSATVEAYIRESLNDERIKIKKISQFNSEPTTTTDLASSAYRRVEEVLNKLIPNVIPTPYLMIGATDSRYYRKISEGVVNFFPMSDAQGFHGVNERIMHRDFGRGIEFYRMIITDSDRDFKQ